MKKYFTLLLAVLFVATAWAQNADYLLKKDFQTEKKKITDGIDAAKKTGYDAKRLAAKHMAAIDSLSKLVANEQQLLAQNNDSLQKTTARCNDQQAKIDKNSASSRNYTILVLVIIAVVCLLFLALIFFLKSKTDEKIRELSDENIKLGEAVKQDVNGMKEELKKLNDSVNKTVHELSANVAARIEQSEAKLGKAAAEFGAIIDKLAKEQSELKSNASANKSEHKSLQEKIESEVKGLRSMHIKDIEDIKSKL